MRVIYLLKAFYSDFELCYFKKLQMLVLFLDPKGNERFFVKFCFDPHIETTLKVFFNPGCNIGPLISPKYIEAPSVSSNLVPCPHIIGVSVRVNTLSNVSALFLNGNQHVQGSVVEACQVRQVR